MSESKPVVLQSTANPTVRHLVKMRDNRARRKANRILVDGWRETSQAIRGGLELCGIYFPESISQNSSQDSSPHSLGANEGSSQFVVDHAIGCGKAVWVTDSIMDKIGFGQSARGVVSEFVRPATTLADLELPAQPMILVLDGIEKPGNVGAVFRCADAAGFDAVLLSESVDRFNPNAIRSSLGTVFHVPSGSGTEQELAAFLVDHSIRPLAARVESSQSLWASDLTGPLALILGSEADGLGERWQVIGEAPIEGVRIPMAGRVDSLNISASAAILAFEAKRQRQIDQAS